MSSDPDRASQVRPPGALTSLITAVLLFVVLLIRGAAGLTASSEPWNTLAIVVFAFLSSMSARQIAGPLFAAWVRLRGRGPPG